MHTHKGTSFRGSAAAWIYVMSSLQVSAQADHYIECFMLESWLEHLRQHDRVSADLGCNER